MSSVLSFAPLDLVDLLLNLERLEVVELWFVRLELGVELVFATLFLLIGAYGARRGLEGMDQVDQGSDIAKAGT